MLRQTKSSVIDVLEEILHYKKSLSTSTTNNSRKRIQPELGMSLFIKLVNLLVLCDRQAIIEPSKANTEALLASASALHLFFKETICRLLVHPDWEKLALKLNFLELSFSLSSTIICPDRGVLEAARVEIREHADEQKRMRIRAQRVSELIDIQADLPEEDKEMTIEDAVLVIQKFERVYQAICRYNYLKHVYQRAMDIREGGTTMTDEEAITRIQARTRGYFVRKRVRQMRQKEADILGLSTRALLNSMRLNTTIFETLSFTEKPLLSLEGLLQELKDNFFPPIPEIDKKDDRILHRKAETEDLYHELCLRRIVKENKRPRLTMNELISDTTTVTVDGRSFLFDLRLFLNCSLIIPLALRGWYHKSDRRWLLFHGEEGSGKSAWTEAVAASTGAVHIRISAQNLVRVRRRIVGTITRYIRADSCVVVTVDKLEVFKMSKRTTTASQNLLKILLTELKKTQVILIGMTRSLEIQPQILGMFNDFVHLKPLKESHKTEVIARFLIKLEDAGRLPKLPEKLSELRRETAGLGCGKTGKVVRSKWSRAPNKEF